MLRSAILFSASLALAAAAAVACTSTVVTTAADQSDAGGGGNGTGTGTGTGTGNGGGTEAGAAGPDAGRDFVSGDFAPQAPACTATGAVIDATKYAYYPPTITKGACTEKDLTDILAYINGPDATTLDAFHAHLKTTAPACDACAFDVVDTVSWAPFLLNADADAKVIDRNYAGCVEIKAGAGFECGVAYRQYTECIAEACGSCAAGSAATCIEAARSSRCNTAALAVPENCGGGAAADAADKACTTPDQLIRAQCGP